MKAKKALIFWGGWEGHQPENVANLFSNQLIEEGFEVEIENSLDCLLKVDLLELSLIVPVWTMGEISPEQCMAVVAAVGSGVGLVGCHGGMCDSFRNNTEWQFMTGGQWVAHPGDSHVNYSIDLIDSEFTKGLPSRFNVTSEQYYLHVDPGVRIIGTTDFPAKGIDGPHTKNPCKMPQVWTKYFGEGKVFYNALGHDRAVLELDTPRELMRRGFLWAAKSD